MPDIDDYAPFTPATKCDPIWGDGTLRAQRPGLYAFRAGWLAELGGRSLGVARECHQASSAHHEARGWDWGPVDGDDLAAWLELAVAACEQLTSPDEDGNPDALARRYGIRNIIINRRIWTASKGWNPYRGADPHNTHVHFDWGWPGALGHTSGYLEADERGELAAIFPERPTRPDICPGSPRS